MLSLEKRHADRAQRIADNMADSSFPDDNNNAIVNALSAIQTAGEIVASLNGEQRDRLHSLIREGGFADLGFDADLPTDGYALAGIGVINPLVVPAAVLVAAGNGGGIQGGGDLPPASFDPAKGNLNGQAIELAGDTSGGWGKPAGSEGSGDKPEVKENMTVTKLEEIAAAENISLVGASNNGERVKMINEARAKPAGE